MKRKPTSEQYVERLAEVVNAPKVVALFTYNNKGKAGLLQFLKDKYGVNLELPQVKEIVKEIT